MEVIVWHHCPSRKASLALIRKMVHYSSEALLKEVCDSDAGHNLPTVLVEITATVLDQEVSTQSESRLPTLALDTDSHTGTLCLDTV